MKRLWDFLRRRTTLVATAGLIVGALVGAPVADTADRYFSSDAFCANTCHIMTATVAKELYASDHWNHASGVRATCSDCHVSKDLLNAWIDHVRGTKELYAYTIGGINTVEEFEAVRTELANDTRLRMFRSDSKNCRTCHDMAAIKPERRRGQSQHEEARANGTTCIVCHYSLVHKDLPLSEAFERAIAGE